MLTTPFSDVLTSTEQLRALYRAPTKVVAEKKLDHLPPWVRVAIEASRFAFVATADAEGRATVSPKGGRDGFAVAPRRAPPGDPGLPRQQPRRTHSATSS